MEELELRKGLLLGEDSTRQFKREPTHPDSMAGEIVAFCNSGGGKIFVGVNDDGSVTGLSAEQSQRFGERIAQQAWDSVRPPVSVLTESVSTSDGVVLVVSIPSGPSKPYCDRGGTYWVKNGPDKRRIQSPEELARLFQLGDKLYAESQPVAVSTLDDFDRPAFAKFYEAKYGEKIDDGDRYLQTLENLNFTKSSQVSVVGLLLFGKRLPVLLPEMKIDAIWFKGEDRSSSDWFDQRTITGTLSEQYDQAIAFLQKWVSRVQGKGGFNTQGDSQIPQIVFEELVTNALVHRDYFIKDSIKIFIFDDRIEIRSPGKLTNSLTVDQVKRGVRRSRNALLASFAPDLLNYRGVGSGVVRALKQWPAIALNNDIEGEEFVVTISF